jgi:predicted TIM-barrel fold metal-dependent hydrolase
MHVFGPEEAYPLSPLRNYTPNPVGWTQYRAVMNALGIDRAVLVQPSVYGTDNRLLLETLALAPDRLRGVVVVEPSIADGEIAALDRAGIRGVRINRRNPGGLTLQDMAELAGRIAPFGWHIQLQAIFLEDAQLASLVARSPIPVVLDHIGFLSPDVQPEGEPFAGMLRLLEAGNLWIKLSAPYHLSRITSGADAYSDLHGHIEKLLRCRPDRLLWATDWPHTELYDHMPGDTDPALLLTLSETDEEIQHQIFVRNPARLYGFS